MKLTVLSQYKNINKQNFEICLTIDKKINIYELRTLINKALGVKAHYQLISKDNRIMLNATFIKEYCPNKEGLIYRIVLSEETPIDIINLSDNECNSHGLKRKIKQKIE